MDNPWAAASHEDLNETEIKLPSWNEAQWVSPSDETNWTAPTHEPEDITKPESPAPVASNEFTSESKPTSPTFEFAADGVDAFGGFESAVIDKTVATSHLWPSTDTNEEWDTAWTESAPTLEEEPVKEPQAGSVDEWEAARHQKEKIDRAVPPEFLAGLIEQCREIWPDPGPSSDSDNWRNGVDELQDVMDLLNSMVPEQPTLPAAVPFAQTTISKSMQDALRITRHMPLARNSPLARFLASKGSTEWESSIRSQKEISRDEAALPAGWRILEKEKLESEETKTKLSKPATGTGLLSFWTRRASSINASRERSQSPAATARSSADSSRSVHLPPTTEPLDETSTPVSVPSASTSSKPSSTSNSITTEKPISTPPIPAPPTAPSAVSRFLNRFSRAKSGASQLALSSDDLEFLSAVPSAHDADNAGYDDDGYGLGRAMKAAPVPLPSKLPPPIAPPPKPPSSRPASASPTDASLGSNSMHVVGNVVQSPLTGSSQAPSLAQPLQPMLSRSHTPASNLPPSLVIPRLPSPPQPSSRSQTPFTLSPPYLSASPSISPPQTPRPGASWTSSSQDMNDEFSDFYSSAPTRNDSYLDSPTSSIQSPSSAHRLTSLRMDLPPLLPPPPARKSNFVSPPTQPPHHKVPSLSSYQADTSDDDLFRDLMHRKDHSLAQSESGSSIQSPSSLHRLTTSRPSLSFDDFDDFVSSGIRTPSPPPLPAKIISPPVPPSLSSHSLNSQNSPSAQPQLQFQNQHQRTQSLVAQAAARGGRWPASPLPQSQSSRGTELVDAGTFDPNPMAGIGLGMGGMKPSASSSGMMRPQSSIQLLQKPPAQLPQQPNLMRAMMSPSPVPGPPKPLSFLPIQSDSKSNAPQSGRATGASKGIGVLSAQDLSFFEGL
ncbi:hypothetical protein BJ138DRAFT_1160559 [Hygrophoropsis aurantiaca]|uniref:Uncharacterized protein n=1 Tax=Hygrophoropsis aurantiaca TaxID=72124 RepID=A0ACB8A1T2_9AGAM|nr:hypothetical protein BJ138DRAFT_1160559 [Hygrophoropsis aurantiaca]